MKIAVLSRNPELYSTKRIVEAALQRGHECVVIDHLKCTMLNEPGKPRIFYKGEEITGIDAIVPRIGSSATFYGTAVVRQFEMMKTFSVNSSVSINRSRDKLRSLQIFSRHDIGIPKTVFANHTTKNIGALIDQVGGVPCVIKLLQGTQGIGVVLAETDKVAKSIIEAFFGLEASFLVQEFIKEAGGADIRCFVVNGRVVGAMKRQGKEGEFRSNLHRGGSAKVIKITRDERRTALLAARSMGLNVAGVDLLQSSRGPLILEVNSSPGLEGIEGATQVDIAGKIIEFIESKHKGGYKKDKILG
ncbi:MAG TPA: 30S ribosomal protein S6--L-glutamate ligase [Flavobacteriales bacterium]|nr:30S ribosomal protein S6--L-glutamate ligase [Flavobacteriales bacterium]